MEIIKLNWLHFIMWSSENCWLPY